MSNPDQKPEPESPLDLLRVLASLPPEPLEDLPSPLIPEEPENLTDGREDAFE